MIGTIASIASSSQFYLDDRGDREQSQAIQRKPLSHDGDDRSDPNIFQTAPVIPRFNALSALRSKKCVPKWRQQTRKSGDESLARVDGIKPGFHPGGFHMIVPIVPFVSK